MNNEDDDDEFEVQPICILGKYLHKFLSNKQFSDDEKRIMWSHYHTPK